MPTHSHLHACSRSHRPTAYTVGSPFFICLSNPFTQKRHRQKDFENLQPQPTPPSKWENGKNVDEGGA
eukprot:m.433738 g.433738  ORF g.433738 m.433738 type:complete len:68 (-) comp95212_c0_seq1:115-318(-)